MHDNKQQQQAQVLNRGQNKVNPTGGGSPPVVMTQL
jgi:hypothetical protein